MMMLDPTLTRAAPVRWRQNAPQLTFVPDTPTPTLTEPSGSSSSPSGGSSVLPAYLRSATSVRVPTIRGGSVLSPTLATSTIDVADVPPGPIVLRDPGPPDESTAEIYYYQRELQEALDQGEAWRQSSEEYQGYLRDMAADRDYWRSRAESAEGSLGGRPSHRAPAGGKKIPLWVWLALGGGGL